MKVKRDGTVKLERGEIRVGNFFVKDDGEHIKLQDLNSVFSHRVHKRIAIGIWLTNMFDRAKGGDEGAINSIKTYIGAMWSLFSVAPDDKFVKDVVKVSQKCLERHPDWYGIKKDATDEEDAEVIQEVKEMKEFEEKVKNMEE